MEGGELISAEGYRKLQEEWETLWREERPRLLEEIAAAAAQGDRSENAEYIYGRKRLREIDKRLRFLGQRLERCKVAVIPEAARGEVQFGASVELERVAPPGGTPRMTVQIVGADEIEPAEGRISKDSPIGMAIAGKRAGDTAEVKTPRGIVTWKILSISYS